MATYNYEVRQRAINKIYTFYTNVAKKYSHTYSLELMLKNIDEARHAIFFIEDGLLRREPTIKRWKGLLMTRAKHWYYAYRIDGDTVIVEDACHEQNMHD